MAERLTLENTREAFEKNLEKLKATKSPFVDYSNKAFQQFLESGFPTYKQEDWKYIDLEKILKSNFQSFSQQIETSIDTEFIEKHIIDECKNSTIVLIDGKLANNNSYSELEQEIVIGTIKENFNKDICKNNFNQISEQDSFSYLNSSFASDGLFIYIPESIELKVPIEILYVSTSHKAINYPRLLILAGKHSKATIFIKTVGTQSASCLNNIVSEIALEENSKLDITYLQKENENSMQIALTDAKLEANSELNIHSYCFGAALSRHKIIADINGKGASCNLNGLYKQSDSNSSHNQIVLNHNVPYCSSSQLYKGVLDGEAKAEFSGTINVAKHAIGTNAKQLNKNLLLSNKAKVDTRPQLQINADDVKCSHGATTGQIDEEEVFYLMSRGFKKEKAIEVLTKAFADEIIEKSPFKAYLVV